MIGLSMTAYGGKSLEGFEAWVGSAKELGFEFIEILSEWPHYLKRENASFFREVLDSYGLKATVHAPFSDLNIASFNERIREASLEVISETVELASELGALIVTVHPGHCSPISVKNRENYLEIHRRSLMEITRWSEEYGIKIGVENMPCFPILDAQNCDRLMEIIGGMEIDVTFDVGHLNTTTRNFDRFIELFGGRIVHVHLHDNSGKRDEHLSLGDGTVPWKRVVPKLPDVTWALEVSDLKSARRSLEFLRNLH
ncbi:sugar phosphate isomerase/epimerase [Thermococcus sp. Bubb.Bath]|uniref:sugar phosphate isomerase/epimerase family protein n=1 Tax=Thermococcus sp. Bubb.Bath TaxID=1638242 RepID=UPI00143C5E09|nr:sugar phosphate isomerase/epimerase family protein [Thermococcus sp. Bubb.Bath]NJF25909.1 sugar phosphate isomerase/epimerase [Thermococcus sp. Bubb.Bath]